MKSRFSSKKKEEYAASAAQVRPPTMRSNSWEIRVKILGNLLAIIFVIYWNVIFASTDLGWSGYAQGYPKKFN